MLIKGQEHLGHLPPEKIAGILREQQNAIAEYLRHATSLHERIIAYEQQYELSSAAMLEAVSSGEMEETSDVCEWIMDYHEYREITADWPALEPASLD